MMRIFLLIAASNLLAPLWGQEVMRFDTVQQNVVGSFAGGVSVYERDSGYLVFSVQKGLADLSQDIFVGNFNGSGGFESQLTFQSFQQDWMGSSSPLQPAGSGFLTGVARFGVIGPLDSLFLYRFDSEGDTAWTRFVAVDTAYAMRGTAVTAAGDVLLTGIHYPGWSDGGNEAFVYYLDSTGTIKGYHGYADLEGQDVVEGLDRKWYVGGKGLGGNVNNRAVLLKSDTTGQEIWRRVLPDYGQYTSLIPLRDSNLVGLGSTGDGVVGGYSLVIKYDTAGEVVWRRDLLQSDDQERASRFHAGYESLDSSLVVCGWLSRSDTQTKGTVVKLDKDGEVLWSRLYSHFEVGGVLPWQMFWDVKPTSDGGLVLTGEANSDDYPYGQLWLLKLDSLGCLVPGCNTVGMVEVVTDLQGRLSVSPNPASDQVRVELRCPEGFSPQGAVRLLLVDVDGHVFSRQVMVNNLDRHTVTVDVRTLLSGTYFVHLADQKRWLAGTKLVVE